MTRLEDVARNLASELSEVGEEDWRHYINLALQVCDRLDYAFHRQLNPFHVETLENFARPIQGPPIKVRVK